MSAKLAQSHATPNDSDLQDSTSRVSLKLTRSHDTSFRQWTSIGCVVAFCAVTIGPGAMPFEWSANIADGVIACCLFVQLIHGDFRRKPVASDWIVSLWLLTQIFGTIWGMHTKYYSASAYTERIFESGAYGPLTHLGDVAAAIGVYFCVSRTPSVSTSRTLLPIIASAVGVIALSTVEEGRNLAFGTSDPRIQATFTNPNLLGAFVCATLPFAAAWTFEAKTNLTWRIPRAALTKGLIAVVVLTQSRGAILGCVIGLLFVALSILPKFKASAFASRRVLFPVCAAILVIGGLMISPRLLHQGRSVSDAQRQTAWRAAVEIISQHPLLGLGDGAYPAAEAQLHLLEPNPVTASGLPLIPSIHLHAHDLLLQAWIERGFVGALLVIAIIAASAQRAAALLNPRPNTSSPALQIGAVGSVIATLCQNVADCTLWYLPIAILFWFAFAQMWVPKAPELLSATEPKQNSLTINKRQTYRKG